MTTPKGDWWDNNSGQNMLAGVEDDADNLPVIPGYAITDMLRRIPAARAAFNRMLPNMLPEEQARLNLLANCVMGYDPYDHKFIEDTFMAGQNTVGIRTAGRYGGTRRGGNR
jgi:hypothetical protein